MALKVKGFLFLLISAICCVLLLAGAIGSPVFAAPKLDGKSEGYDEYDQGWYVEYTLDSDLNKTIIGELWLDWESDYLYLAFIEPLALVDNSYGQKENKGTDIDHSVDWWRNPDKSKTHKFQDLRGSDKAQFVFNNGGTEPLDITVDYLHGFGDKKDDPPYASGGVTDGEGKLDLDGDGKFDNVPVDDDGNPLIRAATSLQYNYEQYGGTHPQYFGKDVSYSPATNWNGIPVDYSDPGAVAAAYETTDPNLSGWIFDVIYEVKVDRSLINGFDSVNDLSTIVAHVSPRKNGYDVSGIGNPIPEPVPEPATMLLLGSGLVSLAGFRRKLKKS